MPVFDAKHLGSQFEGETMLAAILHPTKAARTRAVSRGRERAERSVALTDPATIDARFSVGSLAPTSIATT